MYERDHLIAHQTQTHTLLGWRVFPEIKSHLGSLVMCNLHCLCLGESCIRRPCITQYVMFCLSLSLSASYRMASRFQRFYLLNCFPRGMVGFCVIFRWVSVSVRRAEWSQTTINHQREACSRPQTPEQCIKVCVLNSLFMWSLYFKVQLLPLTNH